MSSSSGGWKSDIKLWAGLVSFFLFSLFIFGCISWAFIAARRLSVVVASGGSCLVAVNGLLVAVAFTCCGAWVLEPVGSVVVLHGLSCPWACGILVSGPGIEPMSPALEGRCPTTGSPRKFQACFLLDSPSLACVWPCGFTRPSCCVSLCPNFLSSKGTSHSDLGPC